MGSTPSIFEKVVVRAVGASARRQRPEQALRMLLRLDSALYALEGQAAVAYGDGLHVKVRLTNYYSFFTRRIGTGERVLDVGCGQGALTEAVALECGAAVVGIDLEERNIAVAKARHSHPQVTYLVGDVLETIPGGQFDVVILSNVLEHLENRTCFLRDLVETVRPARLLVRVPTFERDWRVPLKKELDIDYRLDATHETEYTLETFAAEMKASGLSVLHQEVRWGEIWAEVIQRPGGRLPAVPTLAPTEGV